MRVATLGLMLVGILSGCASAQPVVPPACTVNATCLSFYVPSITFTGDGSVQTTAGGGASGVPYTGATQDLNMGAHNILTTSSVTASAFFGDGSHLTGVAAGSCGTGAGASSVKCSGTNNTAANSYDTVSGGNTNAIDSDSGDASVIAGGEFNHISFGGGSAVISGGISNSISGSFAVIAGGSNHNASGLYSFTAGGYHISNGGSYAFGAGQNVNVNHNGAFAFSGDGTTYNTHGNNSANFRVPGGFYIDGGGSLTTDGGNISTGSNGYVSANGGSNIVYRCTGSSGGTSDGVLSASNANTTSCPGGTWTATHLKVD